MLSPFYPLAYSFLSVAPGNGYFTRTRSVPRPPGVKAGILNLDTESRKRKQERKRNLWKKVPSDRFGKKY